MVPRRAGRPRRRPQLQQRHPRAEHRQSAAHALPGAGRGHRFDPDAPVRALLEVPEAERAQLVRWSDGGPAAPSPPSLAALLAPALVAHGERVAVRHRGGDRHLRGARPACRPRDRGAARARHRPRRRRRAAPRAIAGHARRAAGRDGHRRHVPAAESRIPIRSAALHAHRRPRTPRAERWRARPASESPSRASCVSTRISARARPPRQVWNAGPAGPDDAAYLIYTSGSTGQPKGVLVPHRAVRQVPRRDARGAGPRCQRAPRRGHDAVVRHRGARAAAAARGGRPDRPRRRATRPPMASALRELLEGTAPPRAGDARDLALLLEAGWRGGPGLQGAVRRRGLAAPISPRRCSRAPAQLWNMYGPTETTVWSTVALRSGRAGGDRHRPPDRNTSA